MNDYYLKASDDGSLMSALREAGITDGQGNCLVGNDLSVIGNIPAFIAMDDDDVPPMLDGWHANLRTTVPLTAAQQAMLPLIPAPSSPVRGWV